MERLSILTNLTLSLCLSEKKSFHSSFWVSLSAMIFPGKATFPTWLPKPVADWESSIVQSFLGPPELLTTYKAFVRSLMEYCSPLGLVLLPPTFLGFTLWKPRHFGSLASPAMRQSLWASHSHRRLVGGLSVFYRLLSSLAPLLSLQFVPTTFPQRAQGPPTTPFW